MYKKQAEKVSKNKEKTRALIEKAIEKSEKNKNQIASVFEDLKTLIQLVIAWAKFDYREVSYKTIVMAIAAIIYFVNPFDLIPDFIFGLGYLDDITVIGMTIKSIKKEIEKFKEWRQSQ